MHHSEWLDLARAVPVGQKRRHYHGAEPTKALDVWNNEDSWSSYCHRCHTSGYKRKQFVQPIDTSTPIYRRYLDVKCLITLGELYVKFPYKYKLLVKLLHDKRMSTVTINDLNPMYNTKDDRLVFRFHGVDIGRDCTGLSPAKWQLYDSDNSLGYVYLQGSKAFCTQEPVIITEDLFSAQKIRYYTGYSTLCLLGTKFPNETLQAVLERRVVIATDGDPAGYKAARLIHNRCSMFGVDCTSVKVPDGLDPKDMQPSELIDLFKFLELQNA